MTIRSHVLYRRVETVSTSFVPMGVNAFCVETHVRPRCSVDGDFRLQIRYEVPREVTIASREECPDGVVIHYRTHDNMGSIRVFSTSLQGHVPARMTAEAHAVTFEYTGRLDREVGWTIRTMVQFSDRTTFQFPVNLCDWDRILRQHSDAWAEFFGRSSMQTGEACVDQCRALGLYTLRCQLTPWSIGPTLSERYWGGGAFHDEMYPFFALISGNHPELAARMPYFRLTTLPQAVARARGQGALYPWSSTEYGEERDPDGLWLTERFHLAQFAAEIWSLWLYERRIDQLEDLYPVLRALARYYELNVLERRPDGPGTVPCVDFDESVGPVRNGPFTVAGAQATLGWAAMASEIVAPSSSATRWRELAHDLSRAVYSVDLEEAGGEVFGIPGGVPIHYSILGHVFPFRTEVHSERARRSAKFIHRFCRSTAGWKPGYSSVYDGSNWIWTAGHLAVVHAMQGSPRDAWEAVSLGPAGCGPGGVPNEHLDRNGVVRVPWFTTGIGAWIYALHVLAAWVDEEATHLASALPPDVDDFTFERLRGACGVLISGAARRGILRQLSVLSPAPVRWRFSIPNTALAGPFRTGQPVGRIGDRTVFELDLPEGRSVDIIP